MQPAPASGRTAVALLAAAVATRVVPAYALHRNSPAAIRVTNGAAITLPPTRSWGYTLAFASRDDLAGTGSTGRQAFVFSLFDYDCAAGLPGPELSSCRRPPPSPLAQVTEGPGDPDNPSVGSKTTLVAFDADGAYWAGTGPGVGHRQIFLLNRVTHELLQLTAAADGDSIRPTLSEKTADVVFESTASLRGGGSGVSQIFVFTAKTRLLTQLTHGAGPSTHPMPAKLASVVVFESTADLRGDGHDTGVSQIFWYDRRKGQLFQLTNGNGPSRAPWVAAKLKVKTLPGEAKVRAPAVVFESEATDLPGTTGGAGPQLYVASTKYGDLPPVRQLTPVTVAGCAAPSPGTATVPAVDVNGRRIAFVGTGDPLCNGTTGRRLFVLDASVLPPVLRQLTARGDVVGPVAAPLGLWFAAAATTDDLTGAGVCGSQIHVVDYYAGGWMPATVAGALPVEPPVGDPTASCDDGDPCTADACSPTLGCQHTPVPCP